MSPSMTLRLLQRSAMAAALTGAACAAHAQAVTLQCPAGATAGTPATPVALYTGAGWEMRSGPTGASWSAASTAFKHNNWYPSGSTPANGNWLSLGAWPAPADIPTPANTPFSFRSPVIQVDAQIDLSTITVSIEQTADNYYRGTALYDPATGTESTPVPYTGANFFANLQPAITPSLPWVTGANQLVMLVQNAEVTYNTGPTGLYAAINITANCLAPTPAPAPAAVQPVPANNPWALMLAAAGLAGLGAHRLRRRRSNQQGK